MKCPRNRVDEDAAVGVGGGGVLRVDRLRSEMAHGLGLYQPGWCNGTAGYPLVQQLRSRLSVLGPPGYFLFAIGLYGTLGMAYVTATRRVTHRHATPTRRGIRSNEAPRS